MLGKSGFQNVRKITWNISDGATKLNKVELN